MATVADLYRDIGTEIGDPSLANVFDWEILLLINKAVKDIANETNCLFETDQITGMYRIEVVDYSSLSGDIITIQTSADSAASTYTEGSEWSAGATNAATAALIASSIHSRHSNIRAYSDGVYAYITVTGGYTMSTCSVDSAATVMTASNSGYEIFSLKGILTEAFSTNTERFRKVRFITEAAASVLYESSTREQWNRYQIDDGYTGYNYFISPDKKMYIKTGGSNLKAASIIRIDYLYNPTALSAATDELPSLINDFPDAVVQRAAYYFWRSQGEFERSQVYNREYRFTLRDIKNEVKSQGVPLAIRQFYQWH